ncbi:MAG: ABC transporter permease [Lentisphaerae bacterium]|nr:ABC transporter permease [Lentisphaerota bacterium]
MRPRSRWAEVLVTLPSFAWLALLFVIPALVVFAMALKPVDSYGGIGAGWTLETLRHLGNPNYPGIIWRTVWMSLVATVLCVLLALPMAYVMARAAVHWRRLLVLLVVVPFWTSFLVRTFAWKALLHPEGLIKRVLAGVGLVDPGTSLLYRAEAVLLVMIYTSLPFAILPLYAAAEKFDFNLIAAARDLGASKFRAFRTVFLPGVQRGLVNAFLMVFIPCLGSYVIPDLMGGTSAEMIGNKIAQRTFLDRNLPHASALSALLTLAVVIPLGVGFVLQARRGEARPGRDGEGSGR